mmetsp:Transcript_716/g.1226  ORF Transcript_716/g.1226 Transcript_716/m.1226 type:complete len:228 (+) Transcript_716:670-1353(+)
MPSMLAVGEACGGGTVCEAWQESLVCVGSAAVAVMALGTATAILVRPFSPFGCLGLFLGWLESACIVLGSLRFLEAPGMGLPPTEEVVEAFAEAILVALDEEAVCHGGPVAWAALELIGTDRRVCSLSSTASSAFLRPARKEPSSMHTRWAMRGAASSSAAGVGMAPARESQPVPMRLSSRAPCSRVKLVMAALRSPGWACSCSSRDAASCSSRNCSCLSLRCCPNP